MKLKTESFPTPPPVAAWFQGGFHAFVRPYLRRHFHSVSLCNNGESTANVPPDEPLIVYANHPSWWDPLIAHFVNKEIFDGRQFYAPIDASALAQYKVFAKLGFYGVDMGSISGSAAFLKTSLGILNHGGTALWITPEGRFSDCRDHTAPLMPGLAHLCTKLDRGRVVPMVMEYVFWEERLPECLVRFGSPMVIADRRHLTKPQWTELLTQRLRDNQSRLAQDSISRDGSRFSPILRGGAGAGGVYDSFRRMGAWVTGQKFRPAHGEKLK